MTFFKDRLKPVVIKTRGDSKFATARQVFRQLVSQYNPAPEVQITLMAYAFEGDAAIVFTEITGEQPSASAEEVWKALEARLFNKDLIEAQRAAFYAIRLKAKETVSEMAARLHDAAIGLPEMLDSSKGILLQQRLKEALPRDLQKVYATIRQTHSVDAAAAVISQVQAISSERILELADQCQQNQSGAKDSTSGQESAANAARLRDAEELLQAVKDMPVVVKDTTKEKGSAQNPVGPNPRKPEERIQGFSSLACHRCKKFGHLQFQRQGGKCMWPTNNGSGLGNGTGTAAAGASSQ